MQLSLLDLPTQASSKVTLYDFQQRYVEALLRNYYQLGIRRQILFAPTGSGKTVMASALIHDFHKRGLPCLFVVAQEPLVEQTVGKLSLYDIECGIIKGGVRPDPSKEVQIASIQALNKRKEKNGLPPAKLVILDEAHGSYSKQYRCLFEHYQDALIIGPTATPFRTKKTESLGELYETIVGDLQTTDMIERGALVPVTVYTQPKDAIDLSKVRITQGDFSESELRLLCNTPAMINAAIANYQAKANHKKFIAFAVDIEHSLAVADAFTQAGYPCAHVDGDTPSDERRRLYQAVRQGDLIGLSSCAVLSVGFDEPCIEVGLMLRPTMSLGLYLQQVGRILRLFPGKDQAILLDQACNVWRFGLPTTPINLTLEAPDKPTKQGEAPVKECHNCGAVVAVYEKVCPECGYVFPVKEKNLEGVELTEGLEQVDALEIVRNEVSRLSKQQQQRGYKKGWLLYRFLENHPLPSVAELEIVAEAIGYRPGWARFRHKEIHQVNAIGKFVDEYLREHGLSPASKDALFNECDKQFDLKLEAVKNEMFRVMSNHAMRLHQEAS